MANSVVRNATKEDIPIYEEEGSEGDEYLMQNQNFDFLEEGPEDTLRRLQDEMSDRFVTFGGSESEGGLADPLLGDLDFTQMNYVEPKYIPLEYGGSPGIEGLMMKKTTIMEMPADRSKLVLDRIMKQAGAAPSNDPRLMSQLAQVLGRDG
tara:strand:- start:142 stop:594 length:453 start_codon:yes stop_codon:yes gene_type:complete